MGEYVFPEIPEDYKNEMKLLEEQIKALNFTPPRIMIMRESDGRNIEMRHGVFANYTVEFLGDGSAILTLKQVPE